MNTPLSLDHLNKQDIFAMATATLYLLKDTPKYTNTSELFYILDQENFLRLINYFGGREIRIPTKEEISDMLKLLLFYQYRYLEGMSNKQAYIKAGYENEPLESIRTACNYIKHTVETNRGGRSYP